MSSQNIKTLDIQGHRGCRGLYPENTIVAFIHAMKIGVNTLEFDVVISKDKQVIVSHEPFMNHEICKQPDGKPIDKSEEENHNIFGLTYEQIKKYDSGTTYFEKFPHQVKIRTHKPSLEDVIEKTSKIDSTILYNIEIKRQPKWDNIHHPFYKVFADLVIKKLTDLNVLERTTVQCFDIETLQYINDKYPQVRLVYLVANKNDIAKNLELLGFKPFVYSPYFKMIDRKDVSYCKHNSIKLIPWTVNDYQDLKDQIKLGVDGIITDYPDRLIQIVKAIKKTK
jgi:glycerophosphoryl diester phosphodiesterase